MDIKKLNQDFQKIADKKTSLCALQQGSEAYNEVESELNALLSEFMLSYGTYLEEALYEVHDEFCPDNDIQPLMAYIASKYEKMEKAYEVERTEGVAVDVDDFPGDNNRLVMVPSPMRLVIQNDSGIKEIVWTAGN